MEKAEATIKYYENRSVNGDAFVHIHALYEIMDAHRRLDVYELYRLRGFTQVLLERVNALEGQVTALSARMEPPQ